MVLPFCCLHRAFALLFFKIFLHHLLDFIPLDFVLIVVVDAQFVLIDLNADEDE